MKILKFLGGKGGVATTGVLTAGVAGATEVIGAKNAVPGLEEDIKNEVRQSLLDVDVEDAFTCTEDQIVSMLDMGKEFFPDFYGPLLDKWTNAGAEAVNQSYVQPSTITGTIIAGAAMLVAGLAINFACRHAYKKACLNAEAAKAVDVEENK